MNKCCLKYFFPISLYISKKCTNQRVTCGVRVKMVLLHVASVSGFHNFFQMTSKSNSNHTV